MDAPLRWDHVLIWVADLEQAIGDVERLGFRVTAGGRHPGLGTHNALIPLADDSYLELIAREPHAAVEVGAAPTAVGRRMGAWQGREGLADWALLPDDTISRIRHARGRGLPIAGPIEGERRRPDGLRVGWMFGMPQTLDVPFLCGDLTPRERRVPPGEAREHPNGARAIHRLTVGVHDLERSAARYRALLGREGARESESVRFTLGEGSIHLVERSGREGPIALALTTTGSATSLDPALCHGASLALVVAQ